MVVKTTSPEFDYPKGDANVFDHLRGRGRRLHRQHAPRRSAFSFRFGTIKLLVLRLASPTDSRIMYRRTIKERVQALAPFLTYDSDPYMVLRDDGSLVWMWDAYTTTSRFPYSQPRGRRDQLHAQPRQGGHRRLRRQGDLYQIDPPTRWPTPGAGCTRACSPLASQMPDDLRRHMRYPEDMYSVQAEVLTIYHMTNPQIFYNKEDVWEIPTEIYGKEEIPVVPYYEVLTLPGSDRAGVRAAAALRPLEQEEHGLPAGGPAGRGELRQAGPPRLPQRQAGLRPRPGGGPHHQRSRRSRPSSRCGTRPAAR